MGLPDRRELILHFHLSFLYFHIYFSHLENRLICLAEIWGMIGERDNGRSDCLYLPSTVCLSVDMPRWSSVTSEYIISGVSGEHRVSSVYDVGHLIGNRQRRYFSTE